MKKEQQKTISVEIVRLNATAKRKWDNPKKFIELCNSIKTNGVITPIEIRKAGKDYEVVIGGRRLLAAKKVGLKEIPYILRDFNEKEAILYRLNLKIYQEKLGHFDIALNIEELINTHDMSTAEVARELAKSEGYVTEKVKLLSLCDHVQSLVFQNKLSLHLATSVVDLPKKEQIRFANMAVNNKLSRSELAAVLRKSGKKNSTLRGSISRSTGMKIAARIQNAVNVMSAIENNIPNLKEKELLIVSAANDELHEITRRIKQKTKAAKEVLVG